MKKNLPNSYDGMEPFIFICYSRSDISKVHQFIDGMQAQGYRFFLDADSIRAGDVWREDISEAISRCAVFAVFVSHASVESEWVAREVAFASRQDKHIIPIFLEDVQLPANFALLLNRYQRIRFNPDYDNISNIVEQLDQVQWLQITRARHRNPESRLSSSSGDKGLHSEESNVASTDFRTAQECKVIFLGDGAAGKSSACAV